MLYTITSSQSSFSLSLTAFSHITSITSITQRVTCWAWALSSRCRCVSLPYIFLVCVPSSRDFHTSKLFLVANIAFPSC